MAGLVVILFIGLVAFGGDYFGWSETGGHVQIALVIAFVFGTICGFKFKD